MSNEYPRMMYNEDGRTTPVADKAQEDTIGSGWSREPSDAHRRPHGLRSTDAVPPVHRSGDDDLIDRLIARMKDEFGFETKKPTLGLPANPRPVSAERGGTRTLDRKD